MMDVNRNINIFVNYVSRGMKNLGQNFKTFGETLNLSHGGMVKQNKANVSMINSGAKLGNRIRMLLSGMRMFRMEMLGVMFFGMGINKFFTGLLQPAMEMAGVFQLLSDVLGIMFMPVGLMMLDWVIRLYEWWETLDPSTQKIITSFILLGAVIGGLLFFLGMMVLGLGALVEAFSAGGVLAWVPTIFTAIGSALSAMGVLAIVLFAVLVAAVIGFVLAWQENFGRIRDWVAIFWDGIKTFFSGIIDTIKGILQMIIGFFSGDTAKVKAGAKLLWEGVKNIFKGAFEILVGLVVILGLSLFRAFLGILKTLTTLLGEGFGLLWEKLLVPAYNFGKDIVLKIVEGIKALGSKIAEIILSFLPAKFRVGLSTLFNKPAKDVGNIQSADDFILSNGNLIKTNPLDTIMGFKGTPSSSNVGSIIFSPTINITASSNVDIDRLKSQLSNEWRDELDRLIRR